MPFTVSPNVIQAGLTRVMKKFTARELDRRMQRASTEALRLAEDIASQSVESRDDPERRRYPGSRHYITGFKVRLTGDLEVGGEFLLLSNASPVANIIEFGSGSHQIQPSGAWGGGGEALAFPDGSGRMRVIKGPQGVTHPGTAPQHVMEASINLALANNLPGLRSRRGGSHVQFFEQ